MKKIVTRYTKAEDLVGVTWVVGDLRFGRDLSWTKFDDDWHFVDEDVPVQASGIRCVEGDLTITNTNSTVDLSPLANLAVIGGDLDISFNDQLTTLTALDGITTVGGYLEMYGNDQLTTLTGLDGITTVGGYLRIGSNAKLTTLTGLADDEKAGRSLETSKIEVRYFHVGYSAWQRLTARAQMHF